MSAQVCAHESDVLAHLLRDPSVPPVGSAIGRHLAVCAACRETAELVAVLRESGRRAAAERQLPTASQVWWRATVRARLDAVNAVERPMTVAQSVSAAALVGLAASVAGWRWVAAPLTAARELAAHLIGGSPASAVIAVVERSPFVWLAVATGALALVVMPLAALLVLADD